nr:molybdopterin-dependent oxidoreductase [Streptomyces sp. NRRL F-5126]
MRVLLGAASGLIAGFGALAAAELVSAAVRPGASPVTVVGGAAVDRTPPGLKDFAVRHFGTNDKAVLQLGIVVVLGLFAIAIGVIATRHRRIGATAALAFGAVGVAAAASRPDAQPTDVLPSAVGGVVAFALLYWLAGRAREPYGAATGRPAPASAHAPGSAAEPAPAAAGAAPGPDAGERISGGGPSGGGGGATGGTFDRRGFVVAATAAVAASAGAGALGRYLNADKAAQQAASRADITLPRPASPARPVPSGVHPDVEGLSSFFTSNKDFYRVDTALSVPHVDATSWRLRLHGKGVSRPVTLTFQDLLRRELVERDITLTCVSNEVGGPYVGNARWIGVRLADVLSEAGVKPPSHGGPADQLVARSVDGMTIGSPVETVMDGRDALLALGMNGEPLPFAHGFPVRMVVPGLYGYVSACKWLTDLELTTFDDFDAYWVKRTWSRKAPIKTESRIDTPRPFASPEAGTVPVAGVAWAQHKGIAKVEVRVDGGPWHEAKLGAQDTSDTWRQWVWPWQATSGRHTLEVRATDRTGYTQTDKRVGTVPNGATGRHSVVVSVP